MIKTIVRPGLYTVSPLISFSRLYLLIHMFEYQKWFCLLRRSGKTGESGVDCIELNICQDLVRRHSSAKTTLVLVCYYVLLRPSDLFLTSISKCNFIQNMNNKVTLSVSLYRTHAWIHCPTDSSSKSPISNHLWFKVSNHIAFSEVMGLFGHKK